MINAQSRTYSLPCETSLHSLQYRTLHAFLEPCLPRPLSWLPRLAAIRRTVAGSPRSHYERRDLERLFEIQPRAAQKLLAALPTFQVGTSHLVERDALLALLDAVQQADDPAAVLTSSRARRGGPARRTLRQLVPDDRPHTTWESLPASLTLSPGEVRVSVFPRRGTRCCPRRACFPA